MTQFMRAHGADPGPTQRPRMAGALVGATASLVALPLLVPTGAISSVANAVNLWWWLTLAVQVALFSLMGLVYGWVFSRAADDRRGGWLFGISYGFLIWMLGPVTLLQLVLRKTVAEGTAAMGLFGAHLAWGLALGVLFPWVHRMLQRSMSDALSVTTRGVGH